MSGIGVNTGSNYTTNGYVKTDNFKSVQKLPSGTSQAVEAKNLGKVENRFDNEVSSTGQPRESMLKDLNGAINSGSNEIRIDKNTVITKEQAIGLRDALMAKGVPDITNGGVFKNPAFSSLVVDNGVVTVNYAEKPMSSDELKNEFMDISSGKPIVSTNTYAANSSFIDNPSPEKAWSNFDISVIPNDGDKNQAIIKTYEDTGDKGKRIYVGATSDEKVAMLDLLKLASNSPIGFDQSKFSSDYNTALKSGKPNVQIDAQNNTFVAFANGSTMTMNPRVGAEIFVPGNPMTVQHIDPDTAQYKELEKSLRQR